MPTVKIESYVGVGFAEFVFASDAVFAGVLHGDVCDLQRHNKQIPSYVDERLVST